MGVLLFFGQDGLHHPTGRGVPIPHPADDLSLDLDRHPFGVEILLEVRRLEVLGSGLTWLDKGTHTSLMPAANLTQTPASRQGLKVAYSEEIAYSQGWIGGEQVLALAEPTRKTGYGQYLIDLMKRGR